MTRTCRAWLRSGPDVPEFEAVLDELLRLDSPFVSNRRVSTSPVNLAGLELPEGQRIHLHWTGVYRDPRVFSGAFAPHGHAAENLVWGTGPHVCPGRTLAMLELRILVSELLDAAIVLPVRGAGTRGRHPSGGRAQLPARLLARAA